MLPNTTLLNNSTRSSVVLFLSFSLLSLCACKDKADNSYHLPPKEMGKLLMDVHMAESYSSLVKKDSVHPWTTKNFDSLATYYKDIFAHYHITQEQFDATTTWYRAHPADLDSIYTKMIPEMEKLGTVNKVK